MKKQTYSKATLKALNGSITKWEKIVSGKGKDEEYRNCPLCKWFKLDCKNGKGEHCPVFITSGQPGCTGTPYYQWVQHHMDRHGDFRRSLGIKNNCPECLRLAKKELSFLKSLKDKR